MPLAVSIEFSGEVQRNAFREEVTPKLKSAYSDGAEGDDSTLAERGSTLQVPSPTAAKALCHALLAFLAHEKDGQVTLRWTGVNGQSQQGDLAAGGQPEAEVLALRLSAAARGR